MIIFYHSLHLCFTMTSIDWLHLMLWMYILLSRSYLLYVLSLSKKFTLYSGIMNVGHMDKFMTNNKICEWCIVVRVQLPTAITSITSITSICRWPDLPICHRFALYENALSSIYLSSARENRLIPTIISCILLPRRDRMIPCTIQSIFFLIFYFEIFYW